MKKIHFLLLKKLKNTESAQLCGDIFQHLKDHFPTKNEILPLLIFPLITFPSFCNFSLSKNVF